MKKVVDIQARDFDYEIKSNNPVVVEFWIKSCGNCKKFKPVYYELSEIFADRLKFTRINMFESIENLRLAEGLGVEETPTTKLFHKSEEIGEIIGFTTLETATEEIKAIMKKSSCCKE
jgi:thiol-disulfide isomerase/thioredoxin